jgi:hypothetical protein
MPEKPRPFRSLVDHFDEAAKTRKASAARAKLLPPAKAFANLYTQAMGHARKGDPASLHAASRSLVHAENEVITLETAAVASRAALDEARSRIRSLGGEDMAKDKAEEEIPENTGDNFKREPGETTVSGEVYPDPSQSNIGAIRAGKESPADTAADNEETAEVQDEQEAEDKAAAKKAAQAAKKSGTPKKGS